MPTDKANKIVYVLTNPAMPNLTKIGVTSQGDVTTRLSRLYTTGVPVPFECVFACQVANSDKVESALRVAFGNTRVNPKREFFKIEPEQAIVILKLLSVQEVTPQVEKVMSEGLDDTDKESREDLKRSRRPNMNFAKMKIPVGAVLLYKDGAAQVTVADDKHVNYKVGKKPLSLTAVTQDVMGLNYAVQPAPHWTYEGKTLKKIYEETYSDEEE